MTSTKHPVRQEELMAYLDGELTAGRAAELAAHVEQCMECRALVADLGSVSEQLVEWQIEASSEQLAAGVTEAAEERFAKASTAEPSKIDFGVFDPRPRRILLRAMALATVGALLLLFVVESIPNLLRSRQSVSRSDRLEGFIGLPQERESTALNYSVVPAKPPNEGGINAPSPAGTSAMIARTANLTLVTKDFKAARAGIERIAIQHQGYIAKLDATGSPGAAQTLNAKLQIPANQLNAALTELRQQGRVLQESLSGEEVTKQYADLNARLANARVTEQRLNAILSNRTGKVSDVLQVEQEISRVRGEIESMDAERKNLENRVNYATIEITLTEDYKAEINVPSSSTGTELWNAAVEGYRSLVNSALGLAMAILQYGPAILFWAALFFWPARKVWRRMRA